MHIFKRHLSNKTYAHKQETKQHFGCLFVCVAPEPGKLKLSVLGGSSFKSEKTGQEEEHQASAEPACHPHPDHEHEGEDEQVDNCVQHLHLVQVQGGANLPQSHLLPAALSSTHWYTLQVPCTLPAGSCSLLAPGL